MSSAGPLALVKELREQEHTECAVCSELFRRAATAIELILQRIAQLEGSLDQERARFQATLAEQRQTYEGVVVDLENELIDAREAVGSGQ